MAFYASERLYIQGASDLKDLIQRIDNIIPILITAMASAALEDDVEEYRLDDGQTRINVRKRGVQAMTESIRGLERIKQMYVNELNGHVNRLVNHEDVRFLRNGTYNSGGTH